MRSTFTASPALPGFSVAQKNAPWPVWRDSVAGPVRFAPMTRKAAAALWHKARAWLMELHRRRRYRSGVLRAARDIYYALAFDFLNYATGRLDPSYDALAARTGWCRRLITDALALLRDLGLISWQRRCEEDRDESGRFRLRQRTNAYVVLPLSQWRGYRDNTPPPDPATLGAPERVPEPIEAAVIELTHGQRKASLAALEIDPCNALGMALAGLGRAIEERDSGDIAGVHGPQRNTASCLDSTRADQFAASTPDPKPPEDDFEALKRWHLRRLFGDD